MGKGKPVILALLAAATLAGHGVVGADKGGVAQNTAAKPNANLGLSAIPSMTTRVGLPAGAMAAGQGATPFGGSGPGQGVGNGTSAQMAAPGAARSASSAGLTPPGQSKQSNRDASFKDTAGVTTLEQSKQLSRDASSEDSKPSEAKEKLATLTGAATDAASGPAASLDQLPTCR